MEHGKQATLRFTNGAEKGTESRSLISPNKHSHKRWWIWETPVGLFSGCWDPRSLFAITRGSFYFPFLPSVLCISFFLPSFLLPPSLFFPPFFVFCLSFFFLFYKTGRASLYSSGWPGTSYVEQVGLELIEFWDKGVCRHISHSGFLVVSLSYPKWLQSKNSF